MTDAKRRWRTRLGVAVALLTATRASAEVGASLTFASQDRFRGSAVSDGYPALTGTLSYEHASGAFIEASIMAAGTLAHGIARGRFEENVGYAFGVATNTTIDAGIIRADYSGYRIYGDDAAYTEFYAGLISHRISAHLHYAPDYFRHGVATVYADLASSIPLSGRIQVNAHYGLLLQTAGPGERRHRATQDWRIGAGINSGRLGFELALASGTKGRSFYGDAQHRGAALIFSVRGIL